MQLPSPSETVAEPPLVRGAPFVGSAIPFGKDAPAFLAECRAKHGDVFTIRVATQRMTFVLDPHSHGAILRLQGDLSFSELAHEISSKAFGHRKLQGAEAEAMERVTDAHLKGPPLQKLTEQAQLRLDHWLDSLEDGGPRDLYALVQEGMFLVGAETLFGEGAGDRAALEDFSAFDKEFPLLAAGVPAALLGVAGARKRLGDRLKRPRPGGSSLVAERLEAQNPAFADGRGQVELSLLWAAIANTLPATFWTLAHLVAQPAALAAVQAELSRLLPAQSALSPAAVAALPLLQSAVHEALRLSSASITLRRAQRPTRITLDSGATYAIRQGDLVCLFPYLMHHNPAIFENPEQFQVDRFLATAAPPVFSLHGRRLAMPLMPYGGGVSMCPGRALANTEIKQFVAGLLRRFELRGSGAAVPALDRSRAGLGVLPPKAEFPVHLRSLAA